LKGYKHDNIVTIYDHWKDENGNSYEITEWCEDGDLMHFMESRFINRGKIPNENMAK